LGGITETKNAHLFRLVIINIQAVIAIKKIRLRMNVAEQCS
jgi:hypothetical protein